MIRRRMIALSLVLGLALTVLGTGSAKAFGASIALTDVTFSYDDIAKNLSATAPGIGGLPDQPLANNGRYIDTLVGQFAVTNNLPPPNAMLVWNVSYAITFNGNTLLANAYTTGPQSVNGAYQAFLATLTQTQQVLVRLAVAVLETQSKDSIGNGAFDYAYIRDPANPLSGNFAVGSTLDWATEFGFAPGFFPPGSNKVSFVASVEAVPAPGALALFLPAVLTVVALRRRRA